MSSVEINCPYCSNDFELTEIDQIGSQLINCKNCETEFEVNIECELSADHNVDIETQEFKDKQKQALNWINERDAEMFVVTNGKCFYIETNSKVGVSPYIIFAEKFKDINIANYAIRWCEKNLQDNTFKPITLKQAIFELHTNG